MSRHPHKTVATWLAVLGGPLGLHRLYLKGPSDPWLWLHWPLTALGVLGVRRLQLLGVDDPLGTWLSPLLGLMVAVAMAQALHMALMPDARWSERHHPGQAVQATAWGPVLGAIAALMVGATALMASVAYLGQKLFETFG